MIVPLSVALMTDGGIILFRLWLITPRGSKRGGVSVIVLLTGVAAARCGA